MGSAKHQMEQDEADLIGALNILRRAGVVDVCELHEEPYDNGGVDLEDAYKLANTLITRGDPLVDGFGGDRHRVTAAIKQAYADLPDECCLCAKNRDDD